MAIFDSCEKLRNTLREISCISRHYLHALYISMSFFNNPIEFDSSAVCNSPKTNVKEGVTKYASWKSFLRSYQKIKKQLTS